jgi:hypothetical protein
VKVMSDSSQCLFLKALAEAQIQNEVAYDKLRPLESGFFARDIERNGCKVLQVSSIASHQSLTTTASNVATMVRGENDPA